MLGDELRLKHSQTAGGEWSSIGCVIKIPDSMCEIQLIFNYFLRANQKIGRFLIEINFNGSSIFN